MLQMGQHQLVTVNDCRFSALHPPLEPAIIYPNPLLQDLGSLVSDTITTAGEAGSRPHTYDAIAKQQIEAAAVLSRHSNGDIIAWIKLARSARSIEPVTDQRPGQGQLSPSQIHALFALKDCLDDRILSCLELARLCGLCNDPNVAALECADVIETNLGSVLPRQLESSTKLLSNPINFGSPLGDIHLSSRTLATDNLSSHHSSRSIKSGRSKNAENHYWCTVCEEPNSYKDSGNWKKHEKEHETTFVCEMEEAAESGKEGQDHALRAFTSKRRDIMVNHLNKSHGIFEAHQARDLADQWRHTAKKQAWACGFCGSLFLTFPDRLKHIDVEHFRRHQSIHEWDLNKVLLGLLQQPRLERAWKKQMASLPSWVHPGHLVWDRAIVKDLQAILEAGPSDDHHAATLAEQAYSGIEPYGAPLLQDGREHVVHVSDATPQASFSSSPNHYPVTSSANPYATPYHRPSSAIKDHTAQRPYDDSPSNGAPTGTFALDNTIDPAMMSLDENSRDDHNAAFFGPSQSGASASNPDNLFYGYGQSNSYAG